MIDFKLKQPQPLRIVDYHIEMLSVGAADCFIIYYTDNKGCNKLILVDAGNYKDGQNIINHVRKYYSNPIINLAIVTHPDADHFGGFVKMLEKIKDTEDDAIPIKQFWLNNPQNHVKVTQVQNEIKKTTLANRVARLFDQGESNLLDLIESLRIPISDKFAQPIFCKDKVTGKIVAKPSKERDFLGLTIIGPTLGYFEKLAPNMRYDNLKGYSYDAKDDDEAFKPTGSCLSKALDDATDDSSVHNQSSLIFMFEPEKGKKYLFMGDAGVEALANIPHCHKNAIKDIYWLKVPHHGSKHNLDSKTILYLHPKYAYISSEKQGHYLNQCTINALKQIGCKVYSTHRRKANFLEHGGEREGYTTATPE